MISRFRWILLLVFPWAVLAAPDVLQEDPAFVPLTALWLVGTALVLSRLGGPIRRTLWVWLLLFVLLQGYLYKTIWVAGMVDREEVMIIYFPELLWLTPEVVMEGYHWMTVGYLIICVVSWLALGARLPTAAGALPMVSPAAARRVVWLAVGLFVCYLVGTLLALSLGVGLLGAETQHLPFRLNTLISRSLMDFIPALMVLCLFMLDTLRTRKQWWLCLALIAAAATVYTLATTSRGGIIRFIVPVLFLWLLTNRMTRSRVAIFGIAAVLVITSLQFISTVRLVRTYESADLPTAVIEAAQRLETTSQSDSTLFSLAHLARRIGNAEGTWFALKDRSERPVRAPVSEMIIERSIIDYYTESIVRVANPGDYRTPGLLGAFILVADLPGLLIFTALSVVVLTAFWHLFSRLQTSPPVLAVYSYTILTVASEGIFLLQNFVTILLITLLCEIAYRKLLTGDIAQQRASATIAPPSASPELA
jgi:hypothetical protein